MATISATTRKRLEIQGFTGMDDEMLSEVAPWLRFSPAVCAVLMGIGTALASPVILWVLVPPIAALGAIFRVHPFDLIYNYGLRYLAGRRPLPPNRAPRRFACGLAAVWLTATAWAFQAGALLIGYVLGGVLTLVALIVSTTDFCIPSLIYGVLFGRPRSVSRS
jgi:hypothetical protein